MEVELYFKSVRFDKLLAIALNEPHSTTSIKEKSYNYYNEPRSVLRQTSNGFMLKNRVSNIDLDYLSLRVSIERNVNNEPMLAAFFNNSDENAKNTRGKIFLAKPNDERSIQRCILPRNGYEIHYTKTNNESYIEFEFVNKEYNSEMLFYDLYHHIDDFSFEYSKLWNIMPRITSDMHVQKPIDMYKSAFRSNRFLTKTIYITKKLDGLRILVYINNGNVFTVNLKGEHSLIDENFDNLPGTYVFDTEQITNGNNMPVYYAFDLLYAEDNDITDLSYTARLKALKRIKDKLPSYLKMKSVHKAISYVQMANYIKDTSSETHKYDGVIIYNPESCYWDENCVFKYKFVPSIDVETDGKVVCLRKGKVLFPVDIEISGVNRTGHMNVVECTYNTKSNTLIYNRYRYDKTRANSYKVYKSLINAHDNDDILDTELMKGNSTQLFFFRVCHNFIKMDIIEQCMGSVLDIGSGRGGDLIKWMKNDDIDHVTAIEPNKTNVEEFQKRMKSMKINKVKLIHSAFEDAHITRKYGSVLSLFMINSVTYGNIQAFMKKCYDSLENGGLMYILFMDSARIEYIKYESLFHIQNIDDKSYRVHFDNTMVEELVEYKYDAEMLKQYAFNAGFKQDNVSSEILDIKWLSPVENYISKFFTKLVFQR